MNARIALLISSAPRRRMRTYRERKTKEEINERNVERMDAERMPWPDWYFRAESRSSTPLLSCGMPQTSGNRHRGPLPTRS